MDAGPRINTLGKVQLHHEDTHEVILVPTPSGDPKDPLNWYVNSRRAGALQTWTYPLQAKCTEVLSCGTRLRRRLLCEFRGCGASGRHRGDCSSILWGAQGLFGRCGRYIQSGVHSDWRFTYDRNRQLDLGTVGHQIWKTPSLCCSMAPHDRFNCLRWMREILSE